MSSEIPETFSFRITAGGGEFDATADGHRLLSELPVVVQERVRAAADRFAHVLMGALSGSEPDVEKIEAEALEMYARIRANGGSRGWTADGAGWMPFSGSWFGPEA